MSAQVPLTLKAQRSCQFCASRKQGCDRLLPNCSRCTSDRHAVNRQNEAPAPSNDLVESRGSCSLDLSAKAESLLLRLACDSGSSAAEYGGHGLSELLFKVLDAFEVDIPNLLDSYFASVHRWLPIIEEEHIRHKFADLENHSHGDDARLLLAFYVVIQFPCNHADHSMNTRLYRTIRRLFIIAQSSLGVKDLDLLQYGLLLVAYECSQGLESVYTTLSACVSLARIIETQSYESSDLNSRHLEERTLCGYALVTLDRSTQASLLTLLRLSEEKAFLNCEPTSMTISTLMILRSSHDRSRSGPRDPKDANALWSIARMSLEMCLSASDFIRYNGIENLSFVGLCCVWRAVLPLVGLKEFQISAQELETLRSELERFSSCWAIGATFLQHFDQLARPRSL
ncbi:hypothetical protein TRIATDRAFT_130008 [Trichoderma atroviride IMI 206040]|uniref:Zn(2)-C6 fungal-type domain-containing protein n=1 Tax=Hypocrea atroviridis (strain ATCC 20476 / IMI 206040) TaxID=452589 RepID=G9P6D8_HYPAI|nr:uncharacterized protein TRIATDRAFT_130008 [Trichoderma atroviride IMI 206040]EHK42253.1 hypothetical protein TRIATDRAFT_130008 [Trichoderma atroviride IMI 206040]